MAVYLAHMLINHKIINYSFWWDLELRAGSFSLSSVLFSFPFALLPLILYSFRYVSSKAALLALCLWIILLSIKDSSHNSFYRSDLLLSYELPYRILLSLKLLLLLKKYYWICSRCFFSISFTIFLFSIFLSCYIFFIYSMLFPIDELVSLIFIYSCFLAWLRSSLTPLRLSLWQYLYYFIFYFDFPSSFSICRRNFDFLFLSFSIYYCTRAWNNAFFSQSKAFCIFFFSLI